jgi:hypothetical protein
MLERRTFENELAELGFAHETAPGGIVRTIGQTFKAGRELATLAIAVQRGERSPTELTDILFGARHPELSGRRLTREDTVLIAEWLDIRDRIVKPFLAALPSGVASPAAAQPMTRPPNNTALRQAWQADYCRKDHLVRASLLGAQPGRFNPRTLPAWRALEAALSAHGYQATYADSFACRQIKNPTPASVGVASFHSFGIALDIDPPCNPDRTNPTGRKVRFSSRSTREERCADVRARTADTAFTEDEVRAVESIRTVDGLPLFRWGGRWRSKLDTMHFEIRVTPEQLARGVSP